MHTRPSGVLPPRHGGHLPARTAPIASWAPTQPGLGWPARCRRYPASSECGPSTQAICPGLASMDLCRDHLSLRSKAYIKESLPQLRAAVAASIRGYKCQGCVCGGCFPGHSVPRLGSQFRGFTVDRGNLKAVGTQMSCRNEKKAFSICIGTPFSKNLVVS